MCNSQGSSFILKFYFILRKRPLDYLVMLFVGVRYEPDKSRYVWQILFFLNPVKITLAHMCLHSSIIRTLFCISAHMVLTHLPPTGACTHTHTHTCLWLTPFKERFRQNQVVPILSVAGKTRIAEFCIHYQLLQILRRQRLLLSHVPFVQSQTKHCMQVNVRVCFRCSLCWWGFPRGWGKMSAWGFALGVLQWPLMGGCDHCWLSLLFVFLTPGLRSNTLLFWLRGRSSWMAPKKLHTALAS